MQEEDETVDVESYGEETSNGAINMTSQLYNNNNNTVNNNNNQVINNNNNNTIMHSKIDKTTPEDHTITSLNRTAANWDHKNRMSLNNNNNSNNNMNCTQMNDNAITRVTPTSSDQRIDVEYELDNERDQSQERMSDNEEEVIVDNTDDESDCIGIKRKQSQQATAHRLVNGLREMKKR